MDMETLKKAVKLKRDLDIYSKVYEDFEKALTGKAWSKAELMKLEVAD